MHKKVMLDENGKLIWSLIQKYALFKDEDWKEEVFQDCSCTVFALSKTYQENMGKFTSYIFPHIKGKILNAMYRNRKEYLEEVDPLDFLFLKDASIVQEEEDCLAMDDLICKIKASLSAEEFFIIDAYYFHDLTLEKIGHILSISHESVRQRINKILQKVRKFV